MSGTTSAKDAHSLVHRTNPPTASSVPRYRVAQGYRKGDEHHRQSQKMEVTGPRILDLVAQDLYANSKASSLSFASQIYKFGISCLQICIKIQWLGVLVYAVFLVCLGGVSLVDKVLVPTPFLLAMCFF